MTTAAFQSSQLKVSGETDATVSDVLGHWIDHFTSFKSESKVNKRTMIASLIIFSAAGVAINAQAQEKTRAQVRQELIDAEHNGRNFVSDTSYPDVAPVFEQQVARLKLQNSGSGMGAPMTGTSDAGNIKRDASSSERSTCVGPASFCTLYFGS